MLQHALLVIVQVEPPVQPVGLARTMQMMTLQETVWPVGQEPQLMELQLNHPAHVCTTSGLALLDPSVINVVACIPGYCTTQSIKSYIVHHQSVHWYRTAL